MKVLIPFTGGINSTYAMYKWLTETDHEIYAKYGYDTWLSQEKTDLEVERINLSVAWLKENCRDFDFEIRDFSDPYVEDMQPIRVGFTKGLLDQGRLRRRYEAAGQWSTEVGADAVVMGVSVENTSMDCGYNALRVEIEKTGVNVYLPSLGFDPAPTGADLDWDEIAARMTGRYEQFEALPTALQDFTQRCDATVCTDLTCLTCAYTRGYEKFIADGKTGRDFDRYCAEKGSYGPWRSEADPAEYMYRGGCCDECGLFNYLADAAGREWPSVIISRERIKWFADNGADMSGIETEEQFGDWCGRMGRINLDRGVDSDAMPDNGEEWRAAILEAALL
uniref:Uncharacterized protein n=1 Tax=uncultured marine virus TaxID=186617 RepID=A0A0F7L8F1_9VIRU|nr:hypothetical protein [uncultured marine virus]